MAFMFAFSACYGCGQPFGYNPDLVPSLRDDAGVRQPVCRGCIDAVNPIRIEKGLEPIVPLPGAYEPEEVS